MDYWNHVLWSDETNIYLFGSDGVKRVWRQPGEKYKDKCVLPTVKHGGGSVMVWGCVSVLTSVRDCIARNSEFVSWDLWVFQIVRKNWEI